MKVNTETLKQNSNRAYKYLRCQLGFHYYGNWRKVKSDQMLVDNYQEQKCTRCKYTQKRALI